MFGLGTGELVLILIVAILVFGPKRLPEMARNMGKFMADVRKTTGDLKKNFEEELGVDDLEDLHPKRMASKMLLGDDTIDALPGKGHDYTSYKYNDDIYPDEKEKEDQGKESKPEAEKELKKPDKNDSEKQDSAKAPEEGKKKRGEEETD